MEISVTPPTGDSRNAGLYIHPEEGGDLADWCRKWNVTPHQIRQAILHTGTLHAPSIREYLTRDHWLHHPVKNTARLIRNTINFIF